MEKEAKEAFFDELYQLDEEESSEEEQSNASVILAQSRLAPRSGVTAIMPRNGLIHSSRPENSLLRTVSAPLPQLLALNPHQTDGVDKGSFSSTVSSKLSEQVVIDTPIMAKKTADMTAQKEPSKTIGKRKRGQSLDLKPESQQIFSGFAFCGSKCL